MDLKNRWNLKNPPDIFCLDALTRVYPDARIVWTHRDPARVLASVCSLVATVRSIFSDEVPRPALGEAQLAYWSEGIRRALAFRRREGHGRFVDVQMADLVERPLDTVAQVYQVVLTKCDKVKAGPLTSLIDACKGELATHSAAYPEIAVTSANKGNGVANLRTTIATLARQNELG